MAPVFFIVGKILVRAVAKKVIKELRDRGAKKITAAAAAKMKDAPINVTTSNLNRIVNRLSSKPTTPAKPPMVRPQGGRTSRDNRVSTIRKPTQLTAASRKDNLPTRGGSGGAPTVSTSSPKSGSKPRAGDNAKDVTPKNVAIRPSTKPKDPVKPSKPTTKFNPKNFVRTTGSATLLGGPQVARSEDTTTRASNKAKIKSSGGDTPKPTTVSKASKPSTPTLSVLKVPEKVISEVEIKTKSDKPPNKKKEAPKKKDAPKKKELSSFGKAFKTARAKGKGTIFTHNDKKYVAITKDDLKKMNMTFSEYLKKKKKK